MIDAVKHYHKGLALALIFLLSSSVYAQERPSAGWEFGGSEISASGTYTSCACSLAFKSADPVWRWSSSLIYFLPVTDKFELGFGVGFKSIGASYTTKQGDTLAVTDGIEEDTIGPINVTRHATWDVTYASVSAQLSRRVFYGLRVFAGGTMNIRESSRERLDQTIQGDNNIRFISTGTTQEVLADRESNAKSVLWQSFVGVRYAIRPLTHTGASNIHRPRGSLAGIRKSELESADVPVWGVSDGTLRILTRYSTTKLRDALPSCPMIRRI
jgi:hypothetical protein